MDDQTKKATDLASLKSQPETDYYGRNPGQPEPWERFVQEIKSMLVGDEYLYAEDTLRGILETVQQRHSVSEGQRRAVSNISDKPQRRGGTERSGRNSRW